MTSRQVRSQRSGQPVIVATLALVVVLVPVESGSVPPVDPLITGEQAGYWAEVSSLPFDTFLAAVAELSIDWPPVLSGESCDRPGAREMHAAQVTMWKSSRRVVASLQASIPAWEAAPWDVFSRRTWELLSLRDTITKQASYVNVLMGDTLNRVLFVELVKRLVYGPAEMDDLPVLLERLRNYRVSPAMWVRIMRQEFCGHLELSEVDLSGRGEAEAFMLIWRARKVSNGDDVLRFDEARLDLSGTMGLMPVRDLGALMRRHLITDYYVNFLLPALALYRESTADFSVRDGYTKIRGVVGEARIRGHSVGMDFFGEPRVAAYGAARMLRMVRTGAIDGQRWIRSERSGILLHATEKKLWVHRPRRLPENVPQR